MILNNIERILFYPMSEFSSLDSLLNEIKDEYVQSTDTTNILFIGSVDSFKSLSKKLKSYDGVLLLNRERVEDAIQLLLRNVFAIVIIEDQIKAYDTITASRVVRVNHPLARVIIISRQKNTAFISNLINNGSVDGYLHLKKTTKKRLHQIVTEHLAKHEINKMIVKYISDPPKLSKASYLLLDPTLPFGMEDEPVKHVGLMITHNSVPRYSIFYEDLLTKDEILFSGYLSGISIIGKQLLSSKEPIKEINFGGISVVMRFVDDFQFSFFVRNLSSNNVKKAEKLITEIIEEILSNVRNDLMTHHAIRGAQLTKIDGIVSKLEKANDYSINILPDMIQYNEHIMIYGSCLENQEGMVNYLKRKFNFRVYNTNSRKECITELKKIYYDVLILDSVLPGDDPEDFAEYAKDICPHLQIILRIRDKRASNPVISALNSNNINNVVGYKTPYKTLSNWVHTSLKKAIEIKQQTRMGLQSTHNQAIIAKSMIRRDESTYLSEETPELHGMIIAQNDQLLYAYQPQRDNLIQYDQALLGGIVDCLNSIGSEVFGSCEINKIEMVDAHVLIQHRGDNAEYHFGFLINNLDPNTSIVLSRDIEELTNSLFKIVKRYKKEQTRNPRFAKQADQFHISFTKKFEKLN